MHQALPSIVWMTLQQAYAGLARTVYIHHVWPYIWWFCCQIYCTYTVCIWFWPTLGMCYQDGMLNVITPIVATIQQDTDAISKLALNNCKPRKRTCAYALTCLYAHIFLQTHLFLPQAAFNSAMTWLNCTHAHMHTHTHLHANVRSLNHRLVCAMAGRQLAHPTSNALCRIKAMRRAAVERVSKGRELPLQAQHPHLPPYFCRCVCVCLLHRCVCVFCTGVCVCVFCTGVCVSCTGVCVSCTGVCVSCTGVCVCVSLAHVRACCVARLRCK
jgi:hypothetical protein